jgi:uncharacterized protein YbaA (DUF1428 family)
MSLPPPRGPFGAGPNRQHANEASTVRLYGVLRAGSSYGAKNKDENGNFVKRVEYNPDDPKSSSIQRNCISVPWKAYGKRVVKLDAFCRDVTADPRLQKLGLGSAFDTAKSYTQDDTVQEYATKTNNSMFTPVFLNGGKSIWIMEFNNSEKNDFARYCLVPLDTMPVAERLERAIAHLEKYISDDALQYYHYKSDSDPDESEPDDLRYYDKPDPQMTKFRRYYIAYWNHALYKLKRM